MAEETDASANRVEIRGADGIRMAFRHDVTATPPSRPRPENLDEAERRVVGLGGRPIDTKAPSGPFEERGYADPSAHSFTPRLLPPTTPKQG